jgi:transposase
LIPPAEPGGRPRKTNMQAAMNAIVYLLRTGCPWRYLPRDGFPPRHRQTFGVDKRIASSSTPPRSRTATEPRWFSTRYAAAFAGSK